MPERHLGQSLGRFRVDSLVGSGGFAWVYRGYDPELEIPIALKVLKPQYAGDEAFEGRFRREASTAARLRHPHIIRILAVGREEGAVFFAMDYLPHGLVGRLQMAGTLPEPHLLRIGLDVASALAFAHREGVIHRDIKTDNILFDEHGNAIVADFGIARASTTAAHHTATNMVVGTPQYFSPEQARGQPLDGRSDIYSLGVTLFRAATGVLPFQGEDWYEIARQHIEEEPPRPRTLNPRLSRAVEGVILTCLAKDPAQRYPSADALHAELAALLTAAGETSAERTVLLPASLRSDSGAEGALAATGDDHATAFSDTAQRSPWLRRGIVGGVGAALLAATIILLDGTGGARRPDGPAAAAAVPPVVVAAVPEGRDGAATEPVPAPSPRESMAVVAPAPPPPVALIVSAPATAMVALDGTSLGRGTVRREGVTPGAHVVAATLPGSEGCATARQSTRVRVADGGTTRVRLSPVGCGRLRFDVRPDSARYQVTPLQGGDSAQGRVPPAAPLVLPAGRYRVRIAATGCYDYESEVSITEGATATQRIRLLCP